MTLVTRQYSHAMLIKFGVTDNKLKICFVNKMAFANETTIMAMTILREQNHIYKIKNNY